MMSFLELAWSINPEVGLGSIPNFIFGISGAYSDIGISLVFEQKEDTGSFWLFWTPKLAKPPVFSALLTISIRNLSPNGAGVCKKHDLNVKFL
jgi:hypothetical protein